MHTYPEYHPDTRLATFRVDVDVTTCGKITPLSTLDYLIGSFDSDVISMDYRVRGFTRDVHGKNILRTIRLIRSEIISLLRFSAFSETEDMNVTEANIYHTKMMLKDIDLQNYLFNTDVNDISEKREKNILPT